MRTLHRTRRVATIVVLSGFALTGFAACGGDDDDDAGGEPLTEEEFTTQANATCKGYSDELDALAEEEFSGDELPDESELQAFVEDELIPRVEDQVSDLEELNPPAEIAEDVDAMLESANAELDDLKATDNFSELFTSGEDPFGETNAQATELGLVECAG